MIRILLIGILPWVLLILYPIPTIILIATCIVLWEVLLDIDDMIEEST